MWRSCISSAPMFPNSPWALAESEEACTGGATGAGRTEPLSGSARPRLAKALFVS